MTPPNLPNKMPVHGGSTIQNEPTCTMSGDNKDSTFVSQQRIKSAKVGAHNNRLQNKLHGLKSQGMLDGNRRRSKKGNAIRITVDDETTLLEDIA